MTTTATPAASPAPAATSTVTGLPHWETIPDDIPAATAEIKAAIRGTDRGLGPHGGRRDRRDRGLPGGRDRRHPGHQGARRGGLAGHRLRRHRGRHRLGRELALLKRRGCAVVRGHFDRAEAEQWDRDVVDYVDSNHFFENYTGPADDFFGSLGAEMSKPEIYPIYWSSAQMEARQHPRMATVQAFLNSQWISETDGHQWFDPEVDTLYPDRIRRRPPGADSGGLGTHLDPGTLDLWMTEGYQQHFRHLFSGDFAAYDPWDASYRTEAAQYPGLDHVLGLPHLPGLDGAERDAQRPGRAAHGADPQGDGVPDAAAAAGRRRRRTRCAACSPTARSRSTSSYHAILLDAVSAIPNVHPATRCGGTAT